MPLTDDEFAKKGKPEVYTKVISQLQEKQEENKVEVQYDLDLDFDEEE